MYKNKIKKNALVIKTNKLNEAQYENISAEGLKFFAVYLTKIDQRDISTRIVRFTLAEFTRAMNLKEGKNIQYFKNLAEKLLSQVVYIPNSNGGFKAFQLFQTFELDKDKETGEWYIEINAHDKVLELMFGFNDKYFKYQLWNILDLKSNNQIRIYELLKQYENIGERELSISQLRFFLDIKDNEYIGANGFKNLRIKIEACQKTLKEKTDICFDFKRGETGRGGKWLSIIFTIHPNIAKKALIESTAKETKKVLKEMVNKPKETTTQPKYNGFKENKSYPYSQYKSQYNYSKNKYNTSGNYGNYNFKGYTPNERMCIKQYGYIPEYERKRFNFDDIRKIIDKTAKEFSE